MGIFKVLDDDGPTGCELIFSQGGYLSVHVSRNTHSGPFFPIRKST